ncbi:hypothetical protein V2J09_006862 [Rumex salicifolius]
MEQICEFGRLNLRSCPAENSFSPRNSSPTPEMSSETPFVPREKLVEKQRYFQNIHKHTHLKGRYDKITSVAIPLALTVSSLFLIPLAANDEIMLLMRRKERSNERRRRRRELSITKFSRQICRWRLFLLCSSPLSIFVRDESLANKAISSQLVKMNTGEKIELEEVAVEAIRHALKALRKRHLAEEGSEWKDKVETLDFELQQCYKAQSRLSEQLVVEVAELRSLKALVEEKESLIADLQKEVPELRGECSKLRSLLEEKIKGLELVVTENNELKIQIEEATLKAKAAEAENKILIDRWMLQKMQDAERLNEANDMYKVMLDQVKASSMQQLARKQVDGVVRQSEVGNEYFVESILPVGCKNRIHGHDGGCSSLLFEHNSSKLISGGQDRTIKMWDTATGTLTHTLHGSLGSILDLAVTHDNKTLIGASSSNQLYVWEVATGRIRHTLTGHTDKVCAVDVSRVSSRHVVSAAYDRTIKSWDLQKGYCTNTIMFPSNCNTLCFSMDGRTICSGHVDGHLRLWDIQTGKLVSQVVAHSLSITSVSLLRNGNTVLTSGRDNMHNLFDIRSFEVCGTLRGGGHRVASNWSRSSISPDDNYVAAGSVDGSINIWSVQMGGIVSTLKEHASSVLCCSWSELGKPLATSDKNGVICTWPEKEYPIARLMASAKIAQKSGIYEVLEM